MPAGNRNPPPFPLVLGVGLEAVGGVSLDGGRQVSLSVGPGQAPRHGIEVKGREQAATGLLCDARLRPNRGSCLC